MNILAIDTATSTCSTAIACNGAVVSEITRDRGKTHARVVMSMIDQALSAAGMKTADIDAYAVTVGPGSFTGLRIGLAAAKGLAFSRNKPVAGITTLDALAAPLLSAGVDVCAMIDARRGEVYMGLYRKNTAQKICDQPARAVSPQDAVAAISGPTIFVGDGALAYKDLILSGALHDSCLAEPHQHTIRASVVAGLGLDLLLSERAGDALSLMPLYLRKSDAQK